MSMMSPTYLKLAGFDTEYSRFASKYSLYLYKEEGVDEYTPDNIALRGVPVLFIPGNAGSYKQVRSLSSEASRYYYDRFRLDLDARERGIRALDFFTVDFNEDLAAFHGQTVVDQAEYVNEAIAYILALYHDPNRAARDSSLPDPSSVILLGHSMGGVVARAALVDHKYQTNSVNTIITMSTPHARPPVSFDSDIVAVYEKINRYWRDSFSSKSSTSHPLSQTTLISIAGGALDTTVPSDYTSLSSIVPETHGFTVFTSGIPLVWTSMDHLAITWADQLRKVVIRALYEIVDVRTSVQVKPRAARMDVFRKYFLTGLESKSPKHLLNAEYDVLLTLGNKSRSRIASQSSFSLREFGGQRLSSAQLLPVSRLINQTAKHLQLLTDQSTRDDGSFENLEILFCSAFPLAEQASPSTWSLHLDMSDGDASATRLACKRPGGDIAALPASTTYSRNAFDQVSPFSYLQYSAKDLIEYQFVVVVDKTVEHSPGFVHAELTLVSDSEIVVHHSLPWIILRGVNLELPSIRPLMTTIRLPALESALLAWHLKVRQHGCSRGTELFAPLVRQYVDTPHESKFFVNFKESDVSLHGSAPFMPPSLPSEVVGHGLSFQVWSDPTCSSALEFRLRVDIRGSLGKLVIRYRTIFAAFPLLVVAMVLRKQFRTYDDTGSFTPFDDSLDQSLRLPLPTLLLSMTLFATAFANSRAGLGHMAAGPVNYAQNDLLMGSQDSFFWFLVPLAGLISIGACVLLHYLILGLLHLCSTILGFVSSSDRGYVKFDDGEKQVTAVVAAGHSRRRAMNTVLLLLVATVVPYPFAYLVACLVQFATCTKALRDAHCSRSPTTQSFFNYTYSILILMLWVLPVNLPTLVVWIHNLSNHWWTFFSSHHNILVIMPFMLLVQTLASGSMVPTLRRFRWTTNILFFSLAVYAAVYGMTYAYRLHYIANIVAFWLVLIHFLARRGKLVS